MYIEAAVAEAAVAAAEAAVADSERGPIFRNLG